MNREGHENTQIFVGTEVEQSAAYGCRTLFVVGIQSTDYLAAAVASNQCEHIYFGANHSFVPTKENILEWERMVHYFLRHTDLWVTLDFDSRDLVSVLESGYTEYRQFIPMVSVKLPYINQLGYNAVIKLDDHDFAATNPGVWCHMLTSLTTENSMTRWTEYTGDTTIE